VPAYVIFDVEISDIARCRELMSGVKPALEQAGARYLARGGTHKVHEGDWPSFYNGPTGNCDDR
jgi:uncharacterized protein (DUF1330 family)